MRPKAKWAIAIWARGIIVNSVDPLRSYHPILNLTGIIFTGLEGYFRDLGFDQNTGKDSGTPNILTKNGIDYFSESRIHQNLVTGCGISPTSSAPLQDPALIYLLFL